MKLRYSYWLLAWSLSLTAQEPPRLHAGVPLASPPSPTAPEWIWTPGERISGKSVTLRTSFDAPRSPQRATLRCAGDFCRMELRLNDEVFLTVEDYGPWTNEDITSHVGEGRNELTLLCIGSEGPSAVALSLVFTLAGGSTREVITSSEWQTLTGDARAERPGSGPPAWKRAATFGPVAPELWRAWTRSIEISPFDDYEQWRDSLDAKRAPTPASVLAPEGFEVERLRSAGDTEGSWVSLAFDPQGRIVVAREDRGLLRMTRAPDGRISGVETINDSLQECRGLLFAHGALYVNANVSRGLYRLTDTTGDDRYDTVHLLRAFPGGAGHGRNDLTLGPDGMIYSIHGDSVDVPRDGILDHTSPYREARRGRETREGHVVRTDRDGRRWELVCAGLRNPFGIDVHPEHGELFTYDADAEHDMGAPWYRPTRVVHLVPGADYGWRGVTGRWPPYDPDRPDNALAVLDIGKGSPTAVKFGGRSRFPPHYRSALFILDWAYGRVLAVHLVPRGAGYTARAELFARGRPLNVTDLEFGPDGAMYLITGGRKTQSELYRVRYTGPRQRPSIASRHSQERAEYSRQARRQRRLLEALQNNPDAVAIPAVWPYLDHADPTLRHAARGALEHRPTKEWKDRALEESSPLAALTALMALARSGKSDLAPLVLRRWTTFDFDTLSPTEQTIFLHIATLTTGEPGLPPQQLTACRKQLEAAALSAPTSHTVLPVGLGRRLHRGLSRLLIALESPSAVVTTTSLLVDARSQEDRIHFLRVLSRANDGWTLEARRTFFEVLNGATRYRGGRGMPGFLKTIREQATRTLTEAEREHLAGPIEQNDDDTVEAVPERPFVKEWTLEDLLGDLDGNDSGRDYARGRRMFREAQCSRCHRVGSEGAAVGPDLTSVAARFSRRDILESIISPSLVVAPPYRSVEIVTTDGRVLIGQIVTSGDYRSRSLRIVTDPLRPAQVTTVRKRDIQMHQDSRSSPMPAELLNTLTRGEILDLLAYLEAGGNEQAPSF